MLRRIVLIFMICALPLQTVWAAAAVSCAHESRGAAGDPKHSEDSERHAHRPLDAEESEAEAVSRADCGFHVDADHNHTGHNHVGHNHAGHAHSDHNHADPGHAYGPTTESISLDIATSGGALNSAFAPLHPHAFFERPDRPKWFAAF
jgi:hypothetical protein